MMKKPSFLTLAACLLAIATHSAAFAQDEQNSENGIFGLTATAQEGDQGNGPGFITHPPLRITPDKSEFLQLDQDIDSVIVGNPAHASVLLDSDRMLVIVPKAPGATFFTVLNREGKVVMQRHIIVGAPREKYVRLRKTCALGGEGCAPTSVYYCPDTCHPIMLMDSDGNAVAQATARAGVTTESTTVQGNITTETQTSGSDTAEE
jgi:hypothetical protein